MQVWKSDDINGRNSLCSVQFEEVAASAEYS